MYSLFANLKERELVFCCSQRLFQHLVLYQMHLAAKMSFFRAWTLINFKEWCISSSFYFFINIFSVVNFYYIKILAREIISFYFFTLILMFMFDFLKVITKSPWLFLSICKWFYRFPIWIQNEDQNIIGSIPLCVSAIIEPLS